MSIQDVIAKKRDGNALTTAEIQAFVQGYTTGEITDYQAAALLMAIYIRGMTEQETTDLTIAMAHSGEILDLSEFGTVVDKHSTGGIGDKVTLILMPLIASLGLPVAKMSGRGLGYTGGTIDKLEAIPGYQTNIPIETFRQNVHEIGISLMGQTMHLAPADKKIYALRDAIGCVESIPLIASSIMSKKIAAGASKIVLEVTYGSGAFMKDKEQAKQLADTMQSIGKLAGKETRCLLTSMEQPLGSMVGNSLEIQETIQALQGNMQPDVEKVVEELGVLLLELAGKGNSTEERLQLLREALHNGKAYAKFLQLVRRQGGEVDYLQHPEKMQKATYRLPVLSPWTGKIQTVNALTIGKIAMELGAGRQKKEDTIDYTVGVELCKKGGTFVQKGDILGYIYANQKEKGEKAVQQMQQAYLLEK